jgi:hypothetical protein
MCNVGRSYSIDNMLLNKCQMKLGIVGALHSLVSLFRQP